MTTEEKVLAYAAFVGDITTLKTLIDLLATSPTQNIRETMDSFEAEELVEDKWNEEQKEEFIKSVDILKVFSSEILVFVESLIPIFIEHNRRVLELRKMSGLDA